jgi:hypothetical protein
MVGDERHKHWAKVVHAVDTSKASGWAFEGDFIASGGIQDVPAGAVILVYGERGSRTNPRIEARTYVANPDGTLTHHASATGRAWARTLRDTVEHLLRADRTTALDWTPDLELYGSDALAAELERRGWSVTPPDGGGEEET